MHWLKRWRKARRDRALLLHAVEVLKAHERAMQDILVTGTALALRERKDA